MQVNREAYMLLRRSGRVSRSSRAGPPERYLVQEASQARAGQPARIAARVEQARLDALRRSRFGRLPR
jgi:hypothetical protein